MAQFLEKKDDFAKPKKSLFTRVLHKVDPLKLHKKTRGENFKNVESDVAIRQLNRPKLKCPSKHGNYCLILFCSKTINFYFYLRYGHYNSKSL